MNYYFSFIVRPYEKWTENNTDGGALQGLSSGIDDFSMAFFSITVDRFHHFTIVGSLSEFR